MCIHTILKKNLISGLTSSETALYCYQWTYHASETDRTEKGRKRAHQACASAWLTPRTAYVVGRLPAPPEPCPLLTLPDDRRDARSPRPRLGARDGVSGSHHSRP